MTIRTSGSTRSPLQVPSWLAAALTAALAVTALFASSVPASAATGTGIRTQYGTKLIQCAKPPLRPNAPCVPD